MKYLDRSTLHWTTVCIYIYMFEHSNTNYVSHRNTVAFLALSETVGALCSISAEAKETENLTTQHEGDRIYGEHHAS